MKTQRSEEYQRLERENKVLKDEAEAAAEAIDDDNDEAWQRLKRKNEKLQTDNENLTAIKKEWNQVKTRQ